MFKYLLKDIAITQLIIFIFLPAPSLSKELLMLTDDGPPHMIAASKSGIDIDITREVLQELGHSVNVSFAPLKRSMVQVSHKQADLFLPTFFQRDTTELFFSTPIIKYRPTVFSLKKHNFQFEKISDLAGKKLVTFQGATGYFGEEFVKMSQNKNYRELHDMSKFAEMLIKERCEVVVLDYYIFYYFLQEYFNEYPKERFVIREIETFELFPQVKAHVGFHDKNLRDQFNKQFELYKAQAKDQLVIEKYIGDVNN